MNKHDGPMPHVHIGNCFFFFCFVAIEEDEDTICCT